jgi:hypothetical protein
MRPSEDIAYSTLGSGNIAPRRLVERPNKAPMDTTQPIKGHPTFKTKLDYFHEAKYFILTFLIQSRVIILRFKNNRKKRLN